VVNLSCLPAILRLGLDRPKSADFVLKGGQKAGKPELPLTKILCGDSRLRRAKIMNF
jgi:hypothetical protein